MFWSVALSMASRSRGLDDASAAPRRAATVISRIKRLKMAPRFASVAAFRCLMFAHLLWPAMTIQSMATRKLYAVLGIPLDQPLVREKPAQRAQPDQRIIDLQHALLDREREWQELREPITDPRRIVVSMRGREALRTNPCGDHFKQLRERRTVFRQRMAGFGGDWRDIADDEARRLNRMLFHLKTIAAARHHMQDSELWHFPIDDANERSDAHEIGQARR